MIPELIIIEIAQVINDKHGKNKTAEEPQKGIGEDGSGESIPDTNCFI